jgi:hypothetical protein
MPLRNGKMKTARRSDVDKRIEACSCSVTRKAVVCGCGQMARCQCEGLGDVDAELERCTETDKGTEQAEVEAGQHWGGSK